MTKYRSLVVGLLIVVLASIVYFCWSTSTRTAPSLERSAAPLTTSASADDLTSVARAADHTTSARQSAAETGQPVADDAPASGKYEFDVTFIAVDALGLTVPSALVSLCLMDHPPNEMGTCDADGKLHVKWRGDEPVIDGFVGLTRTGSNWSRVRIVAGQPWSVRFFGDRDGALPIVSSVPVVEVHASETAAEQIPSGSMRPALTGVDDPSFFDRVAVDQLREQHVHHPDEPDFRVDTEGNGVFTDSGLLLQVRTEPPNSGGRPSPFSSRKLGGASRSRPAMTRVDFFVHDSGGQPVLDIPVRRYVAGSSPLLGQRTDSNGRFSLIERSGSSLDIEIGGGVFASQRRTYPLGEARVQSIDVLLSQLPLVRGRLIDESGKPLAGWRVQLREDQPPFGFLQACATNEGGNFVGGVEHGSFVRLLASPPDGGDRPAMSIMEHIAAGLEPAVITIIEARQRAKAGWSVEVPNDLIGGLPTTRVERVDSGECVMLVPFKTRHASWSSTAESFNLDGALLGDYALTSFALGASSDLSMRLDGVDRDLGNLPLGGCMQIVVIEDEPSDADAWSARIVTRSHGLEVQSSRVAQAGTFSVLAGEVRLRIESLELGRSVQRDLRGQPGDRFELRLRDLLTGSTAISPKPKAR